jgi:epoxyqueuosine reductase
VDYHAWLNPLLTALVSHVKRLGDATTIARAYVDAGPVPERELAQRGGIGWIGKNTMLIDPARGSYSYLASVLTNLDLALDLPFEADRCGTCRRCIDACPTAAIGPERTVDARRCISYVTIEFKGAPSPDIASRMGDWVFGCDVCQDVCPWNQHFASAVPGARPTDAALARVDLLGLATMHDEEFARRFGSTALTRAGATSVRRNARIAVENQKRPVTTP